MGGEAATGETCLDAERGTPVEEEGRRAGAGQQGLLLLVPLVLGLGKVCLGPRLHRVQGWQGWNMFAWKYIILQSIAACIVEEGGCRSGPIITLSPLPSPLNPLPLCPCPNCPQLNPVYVPQLQAVLRFPQSVGIVGGRPSSSLFFVGYQGEAVLYLDPHHLQPVSFCICYVNRFFLSPLSHWVGNAAFVDPAPAVYVN